MNLRLVLIAAVLAGAAGFRPAAARDLAVVLREGPGMGPMQQVFAAPYSQSAGTPVDVQSWNGGLDELAARVGWGGPWDLVQVPAAELGPGCEQGMFERMDWAAIGGRDHYLPQGANDCGVGAVLRSTVLAWDADKFQGAPVWGDFWDIAKYPGKRGLKRDVRPNLEIALLADGVPPGDVYATLATEDGVNRAFRKLDQLRPYLVWWQNDIDAVRILASGAVLMTSAPEDRVVAANRTEQRHLGVQWGNSLYTADSWAIVAGSPNYDQALRFLAFAGVPAQQAKLLPLIAYGPTARGAHDKLAPELQAVSPSFPPNLATALQLDEAFWRANHAQLQFRFEEWLKR